MSAGFHPTTHMKRYLKIRSRHSADEIARTYINDDAYLRMSPARMTMIATELIELVSAHYIIPLKKILEVTTHHNPVHYE